MKERLKGPEYQAWYDETTRMVEAYLGRSLEDALRRSEYRFVAFVEAVHAQERHERRGGSRELCDRAKRRLEDGLMTGPFA